jgi:translation initiation factor 2 beta subunit (eIF-2beta)/eIF-5
VQVNKGEIDEDVLLKLIEEENLINNKKNRKLTSDEIQNQKVQDVLKKYTKTFMSPKEQEITKINDRMGELRERYEELKFCSIGNKAMDSYDKYMMVNGINKKYVAKIEDNPV